MTWPGGEAAAAAGECSAAAESAASGPGGVTDLNGNALTPPGFAKKGLFMYNVTARAVTALLGTGSVALPGTFADLDSLVGAAVGETVILLTTPVYPY